MLQCFTAVLLLPPCHTAAGELLQRLLQLQQQELDARRYKLPGAVARLQDKRAQAKLRLPPPLAHLAAAARDWQQEAEQQEQQLVQRLHTAVGAAAQVGAQAAAAMQAPAQAPAAGWVAWQANEEPVADGEDVAVRLQPPPQPALQQTLLLRSVARCEAGRARAQPSAAFAAAFALH